MSDIDEELKEVSVLFKDLTEYFNKLKEMRNLLEMESSGSFFHITYLCCKCDVEFAEKVLVCPDCGSSIKVILRLIDTKGNIHDSDMQPEFCDKAARLIESLIEDYNEILMELDDANKLLSFSRLGITPNNPLAEVCARIFVFTTFQGWIVGDIVYINNAVRTIKKLAQKINATYNDLKKITIDFSKETEAIYLKYFTFIFTESDNLSKLVEDISNKIESIKKSPVLNKIYQTCQKRQSFNIDPHAINPQLSGRITVTIRHLIDQTDIKNIIIILNYFLEGVEIFGSVEKYYAKLSEVLCGAVENLIRNYPKLFVDVYGQRININMYLDIENDKDNPQVRAFVGEEKIKSKKIYIKAYDPTLQTLEINIVSSFLLEMMQASNSQDLTTALIHEITHLLDIKIESKSSPYGSIADKIRKEGIATFSEFAYGKQSPHYLKYPMNSYIIEKLMEHPLRDWVDYGRVSSKGDEYNLGEFMCFVFYIAQLKRRFGIAINILQPGFEKQILANPEFFAYAQVVLRILSNMPIKDFFRFYLKYSNELGLKPLITEACVESI